MHHWVKTALRDTPGLRDLALRGGAMLRSVACAEPGLYTLCYHHVPVALQDRFAAQLRFLRQHGEFIDADTAVERLAAGWPRSDRAFLISFDDGYADNVDVALPVLQALKAPAIVFLVSAWIDAPPLQGRERVYMNRADVAAWCAAGLQVGSHGVTHARLSRIGSEAVAAELSQSRHRLAALTGQDIVHFACPWGVAEHDFDPTRDPGLAQACGYRTFFTTRRGHASGPEDFLLMPRHVVEPHWALFEFEALLGGRKRGWWSRGAA
ncbi:polysaccharide deacetylase family protein [Methylobacterium nodulans]|uniref:Chitooligosaccharide deacetylase n=1 Tax=Methylobacterium nodulans (strain LMG 21967 / CNCM I-2342 / ORS 2060) TaxID=460265 RepID=B8IAG6_METNO|nr:polysaccharide deacetylase family protein [Methylobacterium nodulans]ACL59229.1 polysaccharide deacetylase [Methylobacterium nodulans ORS 2060]